MLHHLIKYVGYELMWSWLPCWESNFTVWAAAMAAAAVAAVVAVVAVVAAAVVAVAAVVTC